MGELFACYGGVESFLAEFAVVITGDHSQSDVVANRQEAIINTELLLPGFQISALGQSGESSEDVVACPNMRALQLYFAKPETVDFEAVAQTMLTDERVDQVMWRAKWQQPVEPKWQQRVEQSDGQIAESVQPAPMQKGYIVLTKGRGRLRFWPSDELPWLTPNHARDVWGQRWQWEGDLCALDTECYRRKLRFGDYPNAFERIACALVSDNGGHMWATAFPGAEFQLESSLVHVGGGSHGSLHRLDSTVPLVVAGAPKRFAMPEASRTVDVLPLCLSILGLTDTSYTVGTSHIDAAMLKA